MKRKYTTAAADETGRKYGKWTVLERVSNRYGRTSAMWRVRCECGNESMSEIYSLWKGKSKQCKACKHQPHPDSLTRGVMGVYKISAQARGRVFDLSFDLFAKLIKQNCWYCGAEPMRFFKAKLRGRVMAYNGLDRIDNSKGYTSTNVVTCCVICNRAKNSMGGDEFIAWIEKLASRWGKEQTV